MYEGEHYEAYPFNTDYYVAVFLYALHESFVTFEGSPGDAHSLVLFEIRFGEYLTSAGIVGGQQT